MRKSLFTAFFLACCPLLLSQHTDTPAQGKSASDVQPPASASARPPQPHTLLDGTPVKLRLSQTISSADAHVNQEVPFEVVEDVKVDNVVVLPKGSTAIGVVTEAEPKRRMGRGGKLNINISYARLADNEKVALRAMQNEKGGGHVGAMTGAMVGTAIVFFPAAPLFLFMHGKDITIPQGTEITAFVEGDMHLDMAKFAASPTAPAAAAEGSLANLVVDSSPPGADIEVDGNFVGNTPSTITVKPGTHEVRVMKKGFADWVRKLGVTGGNVHLSAELDAGTSPPPAVSPATNPAPASTPGSVTPPEHR